MSFCGNDTKDEYANLPLQRIDFMGFFDSDDAAQRVAAYIDESVFEVDSRIAADGRNWVINARYRELPSVAQFERDREIMMALGKKHRSISGLSPGCTSWQRRN
jgi:hypothetical protein